MEKLKKIISPIAIFLLICLAFSLASCDSGVDTGTTTPDGTTTLSPEVTTPEETTPEVTTPAATTPAQTTEDPNTPKKPKIAVLSGAGTGSKIYSKMFEMTGKSNPNALVISSAGHDSMSSINSYVNTMKKYTKNVKVLTVCIKYYTPEELREIVMWADLIIEVGGQSEFMSEAWENCGLPALLLEAYDNGAVICGGSAGGMCWTYMGWNNFYELPNQVYKWFYGIDALHFYYGSHYHDNANWTKFHDALMSITDPKYPIGYAMDNGTGIVVVDGVVTEYLREKTGIYIWKYTFENGKWTCVRQEEYK